MGSNCGPQMRLSYYLLHDFFFKAVCVYILIQSLVTKTNSQLRHTQLAFCFELVTTIGMMGGMTN